MKIYTPDYYKDFKCNPLNCKHNCCIGWEIDVDNDTMKKYRNIKGCFGEKINTSIYEDKDGYHFKLNKDERCPFLNQDNLCDIILEYGEDMLCRICKDHPRYRNFYTDYIELGIGLCCEEAGRIILNKTTPTYIVSDNDYSENNEFVLNKNAVLDLTNSRDKTVAQKISELFSYAQIDFKMLDFNYWVYVYLGLENLDKGWKQFLADSENCFNRKSYVEWEIPFSQLLTYFVMRHYTDSKNKETLAFSALSVYMIYNIFFSSGNLTMDNLIEISRMYSSEIEYSQNNIDDILFEIDINLKG